MPLANQAAPHSQDSSPYVQRRALLQRVGDMRPFNGWVEEIRESRVRIRLGATKPDIAVGDQLRVEVAGKEHTAAFVGEVVLAAEWLVEVGLGEGVDLLPKKESPRLNMFGERCKIFCGDTETLAISVDISESGLGVVLTGVLDPGTAIDFEVGTQLGPIRGSGSILYCRPDPFSASRFRAGIEVSALSDDDRDRWTKLQDLSSTPW